MKKGSKNIYVLAIVITLFVSFCLNIYLLTLKEVYKNRTGKKIYNEILLAKNNNEKILKSLELWNGDNKINKKELIEMNYNYEELHDNILQLLDEYNFYQSSNIVFLSKKVDTGEIVENDIYNQILSYMDQIIQKGLYECGEYLELKESDENNLKIMLTISNNVKNYFDEIIGSTSKDNDYEEFRKKVLKDDFWVDVLQSINKINDKYKNLDFSDS